MPSGLTDKNETTNQEEAMSKTTASVGAITLNGVEYVPKGAQGEDCIAARSAVEGQQTP